MTRWMAALAAMMLAAPASAGTIFAFDLSSEDRVFFETEYKDYDGFNPADTAWSASGFFEIGVNAGPVGSSDVLDWGVSFTDGLRSIAFDDEDPGVTRFVLDAILDGGALVIERFTAQKRVAEADDATRIEVISIENKDAFFLTEVDASLVFRGDDPSQIDGFRGRGRSEGAIAIAPAPVPLPAAAWALLAGLGGLYAASRKRA